MKFDAIFGKVGPDELLIIKKSADLAAKYISDAAKLLENHKFSTNNGGVKASSKLIEFTYKVSMLPIILNHKRSLDCLSCFTTKDEIKSFSYDIVPFLADLLSNGLGFINDFSFETRQ